MSDHLERARGWARSYLYALINEEAEEALASQIAKDIHRIERETLERAAQAAESSATGNAWWGRVEGRREAAEAIRALAGKNP